MDIAKALPAGKGTRELVVCDSGCDGLVTSEREGASAAFLPDPQARLPPLGRGCRELSSGRGCGPAGSAHQEEPGPGKAGTGSLLGFRGWVWPGSVPRGQGRPARPRGQHLPGRAGRGDVVTVGTGRFLKLFRTLAVLCCSEVGLCFCARPTAVLPRSLRGGQTPSCDLWAPPALGLWAQLPVCVSWVPCIWEECFHL